MHRSGTSFPRSVRLLRPVEFKRVFQRSKRTTDALFTILYQPNGFNYPRLGMAIAKKNLRRAVDRNLLKRRIRESFRNNKELLSGYDLVVMCKRGINPENGEQLRQSLRQHWERIERSERRRTEKG